MTDNEIIKALECCVDWCGNVSCWDCPLKNTGCIHFDKLKETLDLINRQKAENERLKSLMPEKRCDNCIHEEKSLQASPCCECFNYRNFAPKNFLKLIKAEAIKEFAERLKEKSKQGKGYLGNVYHSVDVAEIDNLLKEKVGENNA